MIQDIEIAILAGGKSSRMGEDKGLVAINGKPMVEYVIDQASQISSKIRIISQNNLYEKFGYPVSPDLIPDCGPIGGIYTALHHATASFVLILSCDIPLISSDFLLYLFKNKVENKVVAPFYNGKYEPMCAIYPKTIKEKLKECIETRQYKMQKLMEDTDAVKILITEELMDRYNHNFKNINYRSDLKE
jgi:molybdopterin-guanine dinucleotide biosynthesis protein A